MKNLQGIAMKFHLVKLTFVISVALPLIFGGCQKSKDTEPPKDTTAPKITIISPIKDKIYEVSEVSITWEIKEMNFNEAWYSIDNNNKVSIANSGSVLLTFENGVHKIVVVSNDLSGNASKDSIFFTVNKFYPKVIFIDPYTAHGIDGAVYNILKTKVERERNIRPKLKGDWTDGIPPSNNPPWGCGHYAMQLMVNSDSLGEKIYIGPYQDFGDEFLYNEYSGNELQEIFKNHGTIIDKGKLCIPMGIITLLDTSHYGEYFGHSMNWVATGENLTKLDDQTIIEPQQDSIVKPGALLYPEDCDLAILTYPYIDKQNDKNYLGFVQLVKFRLENGVATLIWENTDPAYSIKKQRGN
jgi:hypothetical protein